MFFDVEWTETVRKHGKVEAANADEAVELLKSGEVDSNYDELSELDYGSIAVVQTTEG